MPEDEKGHLEQLRLYFAEKIVEAKKKAIEARIEAEVYRHAQEMCESSLADLARDRAKGVTQKFGEPPGRAV